ncbi:TetR/AcrR family transcriptional regulator [Brevibacterium atlanticum]|uniref:TetR/AcrR family transcriptional regulator n=1 Tax=Brevibacterium atlanticum TaxID=2697563 RepID=UPI00141EEBE2|nr:TetR/AcrR family transcriptional regulator [Brevibacterium atlanticum]
MVGEAGRGPSKAAERRAGILEQSAILFRRRGYSEVGIDDIGRAAGVSGPAIYRHFDGKQDLLDQVIESYLDALMQRWDEAIAEGIEAPILQGVVRSAIDRPNEYYAYSNQRHMLEGDYAEKLLRARRPIKAGWKELLAAHGLELGRDDARFRLVAMEGILIHASLTDKASRSARSAMALAASKSLLSLPVPAPGARHADVGARVLHHHNRREEVFAAAIGLFADRGFTAVTLKDIGAEVGVSASAIHRHFDSKDSILSTAVERSAEQMRAAIAVAIARSSTPREALDDIAQRAGALFAESWELFGLNLYLATSLPREEAVAARQSRRTNLDEMAHLLVDAVEGLSLSSARVRVGAMLSVLNNVVRNRRLVAIDNLAQMLTVISKYVLFGDD